MFLAMAVFLSLSGIKTVSANDRLSTPYEINFGESQEGWTAIDNSASPGTTWDFKPRGIYDQGNYYPCVQLGVTYSEAHNDYYVSPGLALEEGKQYVVKAQVCNTYAVTDLFLPLEIGSSATDMSGNVLVKNFPVSSSYARMVEQEVPLSVEASGTYHIAFHATHSTYTDLCLVSFSVSELGSEPGPDEPNPDETIAELPYDINFKVKKDGWNAVDNNHDGYTWQTNFMADYGIYMEGSRAPHDDDFISPEFVLEKGKSYEISTMMELIFPSLTDVITLMVGTDKNDLHALRQLTTTETGPNTDSGLIFTPEESGKYYFSFRNTSPVTYLPTTYIGLCEFSIREKQGEQETPLLSTDFTGTNPLDGWTVLNSNRDQTTWELVDGLAGVTYNSDAALLAADDWLISPVLSLQEGQDYMVNYTFSQTSAFSEDVVEIKSGETATAEGLDKLLATETILCENGNGTISKSVRMSALSTGNRYVGFHIVTTEVNGTLSLTKFEVTPVGKPTPMPVENLSATSNHQEKTVALRWKNPGTDMATAALDKVTIRIYENGSLLVSLPDRQAGEDDAYSYSPGNFTGDVTYTLYAVAGDNESEGVETTICLDDLQGELVLEASATMSAEGWVIENLSGDSKWEYDHGWYSFYHLLGKPETEDDWLISPAFALEAGKRYVVKYSLATSLNGGSTFDVTIGDGQTVAAQQRVLDTQSALMQNGLADFQTKQFGIESDGNYYVGFHVTEVKQKINLAALEVYSVKEETPAAVVNLAVNGKPYYVPVSATLVVPESYASLSVYDASGRMVRKLVSDGSNRIDLSGLAKGLYFARIYDLKGNCVNVKFVR